jgi:hypothetical protein
MTTASHPGRRYMGKSRTHAKTRYLHLSVGHWVHVVEVTEKTALVVPVVNTLGEPTDPAFSYRFRVKLSDLRDA